MNRVKVVKVDCPITQATCTVEQDFAPDNSAPMTMFFDGAQFASTEFIKTNHGFILKIYGNWEHADFFDSLAKSNFLLTHQGEVYEQL